MQRLTRTQVPVLASYSSPFVLLATVVINGFLVGSGMTSGPLRLILLGAAVPIGFVFGRLIYLRRSHVEILFDDRSFQLFKGSRKVAEGEWKAHRTVSIALDQFGRQSLRLYKHIDGEFTELPLSKTNADPQRFRDYVQSLIHERRATNTSLQVVGVS